MNYLVWIALSVLYSPIFYQLYSSRWENIDYTHAYVIMPISIALVIWKRAGIQEASKKPSSSATTAWGMALLILGLALFIFGWRLDYLIVSSGSLLLTLTGAVLFLYNAAVLRLLTFPILYLLLMLPPPLGILDSITLPMRKGVTSATTAILGQFFDVQREGMLITIEHAQVYVGAPCSGFRSLVTMFALALVYLYLIVMPKGKKALMLAAVLPLALFGNLVRVITLSLITYYYGKEAGEGFFHNFSGTVIFLIMMLGLMGIERLLMRGEGKKVKGS